MSFIGGGFLNTCSVLSESDKKEGHSAGSIGRAADSCSKLDADDDTSISMTTDEGPIEKFIYLFIYF